MSIADDKFLFSIILILINAEKYNFNMLYSNYLSSHTFLIAWWRLFQKPKHVGRNKTKKVNHWLTGCASFLFIRVYHNGKASIEAESYSIKAYLPQAFTMAAFVLDNGSTESGHM